MHVHFVGIAELINRILYEAVHREESPSVYHAVLNPVAQMLNGMYNVGFTIDVDLHTKSMPCYLFGRHIDRDNVYSSGYKLCYDQSTPCFGGIHQREL
jgi:hypothetical protein